LELAEGLDRFVEVSLQLVGEAEPLERAAPDLGVGLGERRGLHLGVRANGALRVMLVEQNAALGQAREDGRARPREARLDVAVLLERALAPVVARLEDGARVLRLVGL